MSLTATLIRPLARPLSRGLAGGIGLDPDAAAFASGLPDPDRSTLDAWFRGLKDLGLWEDVVEFWPLLPSQNFGTGSTVRGGKRLANGTLTNGPTWGAGGITFDPTQFMTAETGDVSKSYSVFLVTTDISTPQSNQPYLGTGNGDIYPTAVLLSISAGNTLFTYSGSGFGISDIPPSTDIKAYMAAFTTGGAKFYVNGSLAYTDVSDVGTLALKDFCLNGISGTTGRDQTVAISLIFAGDLSASAGDLYSLFTSTLGAGLGLP